MENNEFKKRQKGFNDSTGFFDIGSLLKKGYEATKGAIEAYVGWLSPKVDEAIKGLSSLSSEPLADDIERVRNLIENDKREGKSVLSKEEEVKRYSEFYLGDGDGNVAGEQRDIEEGSNEGSNKGSNEGGNDGGKSAEGSSKAPAGAKDDKSRRETEDTSGVRAEDYQRIKKNYESREMKRGDLDVAVAWLESHGIKSTGDIEKDFELFISKAGGTF
jgi:hypothetical protein